MPGWLLLLALLVAAARVAGNCGPPPKLENGSVSDEHIYDVSFAPNTKITYSCHPGYQFQEGSSRTLLCREDSTWSPLQARCLPKSCGSPGEILNGYYEAEAVTFGSKVKFYCNEGYMMVGKSYRLCSDTGWDGQIPKCETIKCPDLPSIANGLTPSPPQGGFWEYGMVAKFSCINDYSLIGSSSLTCGATGQWNRNIPTCKIVRCFRPDTPENGQIYAGFSVVHKFGDAIIYKCNRGFVLVGDSTIYCTENSTFEPSPPICRNASEINPTTAITTTSKSSQVGRNVGQQYGVLIILALHPYWGIGRREQLARILCLWPVFLFVTRCSPISWCILPLPGLRSSIGVYIAVGFFGMGLLAPCATLLLFL